MTLTRNDTARWLRERDDLCLLTHRRPDGDTVGSAAALCLGLRSLGKRCTILENSEVTPRFKWLHEGLTVKEPQEGAVLITVDVASPGMLPEGFKKHLGNIALRIDHHASGTSFTEQELVEPGMGSCAEIIFDLLQALWQEFDPAIADAIYVGVSTDTGCFRFANTTAHTFVTAAACAAAGARVYQLNQELFETNTLGRLKIQSWIVEHMDIFAGGRLAVVAIPRAVEEAIGVTEDDMDNISSFPRSISGVCMAATLRQTREEEAKLSVRAIPGHDATVIAGKFGGGGHKGAAGATLKMALDDAAEAVKNAMLEKYE